MNISYLNVSYYIYIYIILFIIAFKIKLIILYSLNYDDYKI